MNGNVEMLLYRSLFILFFNYDLNKAKLYSSTQTDLYQDLKSVKTNVLMLRQVYIKPPYIHNLSLQSYALNFSRVSIPAQLAVMENRWSEGGGRVR